MHRIWAVELWGSAKLDGWVHRKDYRHHSCCLRVKTQGMHSFVTLEGCGVRHVLSNRRAPLRLGCIELSISCFLSSCSTFTMGKRGAAKQHPKRLAQSTSRARPRNATGSQPSSYPPLSDYQLATLRRDMKKMLGNREPKPFQVKMAQAQLEP